MFVELHILQNFAPSNLNRDDTGAPKDCEFGGYRRARISSQCLKRAVRTTFKEQALLPEDNLATRSKRLVDAIVERLASYERPSDDAKRIVEAALRGVKLAVDADGRTQYLLFLGKAEVDALADLCHQHWDTLLSVATAEPTTGRQRRDAKAEGRSAVPAVVVKAVEDVLNGGKAADLALFGRMLADLPNKNIDAACQVAHALSTNQVNMEFDFYTAVDDLLPEEETGAGMMGTVEFNSACFYRYANLDKAQLGRNLGDDQDLAAKTVEAFLRAAIDAVPTGKQNSMAAQNPPSLVMAVVRDGGLWSLANAFARPVRPDRDGDLVEKSVAALDAYWGKLAAMYGEGRIVGKWVCTLHDDAIANLKPTLTPSVEQLVGNVMAALRADAA